MFNENLTIMLHFLFYNYIIEKFFFSCTTCCATRGGGKKNCWVDLGGGVNKFIGSTRGALRSKWSFRPAVRPKILAIYNCFLHFVFSKNASKLFNKIFKNLKPQKKHVFERSKRSLGRGKFGAKNLTRGVVQKNLLSGSMNLLGPLGGPLQQVKF